MQRISWEKEYVFKDLFGILVIVNLNMINHVLLEEYLGYESCKYRKVLISKLVEECSDGLMIINWFITQRWLIAFKYFVGYISNDGIIPFCVKAPQMNAFSKYFDSNNKYMKIKIMF